MLCENDVAIVRRSSQQFPRIVQTGRVCHERFNSGDTFGQCHVEVSNYGVFDIFFQVLEQFPQCTVLVGSQRLAGKAQPPNSMLHISYYEMLHALKSVGLACSAANQLRLTVCVPPAENYFQNT